MYICDHTPVLSGGPPLAGPLRTLPLWSMYVFPSLIDTVEQRPMASHMCCVPRMVFTAPESFGTPDVGTKVFGWFSRASV